MAQQHNANVDPKYQEHAEKVWLGFSKTLKYSIYAIVVILILMALFLL